MSTLPKCPMLSLGMMVGMNLLVAITVAAPPSATTGIPAPSPYEPYKFLIGDWNVAPADGPPVAVTRFHWGLKESYIWHATALLVGGREEPHYEGVLIWNGMRKNLDMLLALDPQEGGLAQEQGTVFVQKDGTVVREITSISSVGGKGATRHFRQTFKPLDPDKVLTTVMRETKEGWVATFPGSDHLLMTRKSAGP